MIRKFLFSFATLCVVALGAYASDESAYVVEFLNTSDVSKVVRAHSAWKEGLGTLALDFSKTVTEDVVLANGTTEKGRLVRLGDEDGLSHTLINHLERKKTNPWYAAIVKKRNTSDGAVDSVEGMFLFGIMPKTGYAKDHPVIQGFMDSLSVPEGYGLGHFAAEMSPSLLAAPEALESVYSEATNIIARRLTSEKALLPRGAGSPHSLFLVYNEARVQEIELLQGLGYTAHRNDAFKGFYEYPAVVLTLPLTEASE